MASPDYPPPHSCQYCQKMVLDLSEDQNKPNSISKARLDLARRIFDEDLKQLESANSTNSSDFVRQLERKFSNIVPFDMTFEDLEGNAANGCVLCAWLLKEYEENARGTRSKFVLAATVHDNMYFGTLKFVRTAKHDFKDERFERDGLSWGFRMRRFPGMTFQILTLPGNPAAGSLHTTPVNVNPASESSFSLARSWLQNCLEEHESCRDPAGNYMPTRLLEILYIHGSRRLRLQCFQKGEKERYAALTYCWGGDQPFILTKRTIRQLLTVFNIQDLPPTLQDAVLVTEKLGLRFLWVDALCIFQDDEYEKGWEIAQMPLIYSHATVTIAASRASGVTEGFLRPRPPLGHMSPQLAFELPYRFSDGEIASVVLVPEVLESVEPLDRRAWALQERLLSCRILEYGSLQTRWTCQHRKEDKDPTDGWKYRGVQNEGREDRLFVEAFRTVLSGFAERNAPDITAEESKDLFHQWHQILDIYTHRALTLSTDRLPAISGIAERYGRVLQDEYIGGLWRSRIQEELLWTSKRHEPGSTPRHYQGPSWSWAAVDEPVRFQPVGKLDEVFEVLDCKVQPSMENAKFGAVKAGHLRLRGRIRSAELTYESISSSIGRRRLRGRTNMSGLDTELAVDFRMDHQDLARESIPVSLLIVGGSSRDVSCDGLVLQLRPNGEYSRLGVFHANIGHLNWIPEESTDSRLKRYQAQAHWLWEAEPQEITIV